MQMWLLQNLHLHNPTLSKIINEPDKCSIVYSFCLEQYSVVFTLTSDSGLRGRIIDGLGDLIRGLG